MAKDSPGTTIFKAAPDYIHAIGQQRRSQSVARYASQRHTVEGKVDSGSGMSRQTIRAHLIRALSIRAHNLAPVIVGWVPVL